MLVRFIVSRLTPRETMNRTAGWGRLLVEHELLGVDQRPEDVLVGQLLVLRVAWRCAPGPVAAGPRVGLRAKAHRNSSSTFSASGRGSLASRSARPPARASLSCTSSRVEQVQRLGQVRLADALALAGADALRPAEHVQEVRRERLVRQHDRPLRGVLVLRQAAERASGCRSPGRPRRTAPRPPSASGSSGRRPACRAC